MDGRGNALRLLLIAGNWLARALQTLLVVASCMVCIAYGFALFGDGSFGWALLLWTTLQYPAIVIHELGHCAGARLGGMRVHTVQISAFEFNPLRRGFRWRWRPLPRRAGIGGYVIAYVDPATPPRRARVLMTASGPALNLVFAAILFGLGELLRPHALGWLCLMFAVINAMMGLANLVPHFGHLANDGLQLWQLWKAGPNYAEPPHARLAGASMAGCTADRLPEEDLAAMEADGPVMRLFALWYRLKGDQNRGEWGRAVARQQAMDEAVAEIDPRLLAPWNDLLALLRAELAFSRALVSNDAAALGQDLLPPRLAWYMPHFQARCLALQAALNGDREACEHWLDACRREAEQSKDAAVPLSEAMLGSQVRALLDRVRPAVSVEPTLA